ncbi:hypothetical protein ACB098_01G144100 [Castanea mollissima]
MVVCWLRWRFPMLTWIPCPSTMIQNMIKEGIIVPSEVTIMLLQRAMQENGNDKFLMLKLCFHPQIDAGRPVEEVFELVKAVFTLKDEKVKCRCYAL